MRSVKTKRVVIAGGFLLLVGLAIWWTQRSLFQSRSQVVLANNQVLSNDWLQLTRVHLRAVAPWSEIVVELPSDFHWTREGENLHLVASDGAEVHIDGYLITTAGQRFDLTESHEQLGDRMFIALSNPALRWQTQRYRFREVALRSDKAVQTRRIIWLSDDPRDYKDGVIERGLK